jgi:hypothetical protein
MQPRRSRSSFSSYPVACSLVARLARPGGDVTGVDMFSPELVVTLNTVKVLGFTVPPSILPRADEVIE